MSYFLTPQAMSGYSGLGFMAVPKSAVETAMADPSTRARIDTAAAEFRRQKDIAAAAALIGPRGGAPAYAPSPSGIPAWLPIAGVGAIALLLLLK